MTGLSLPDEAGHFMLILQRATLPRFASDNRMSGTAEENKAVVQGNIAYFGTYAIDEAKGTISLRYDGSTSRTGMAIRKNDWCPFPATRSTPG